MIRIGLLLALATGLVACGEKPAPAKRSQPLEPPAFWVWHRSSDFDEDERETLRSAGVRLLAWQVAEAEWREKSWRLTRIAAELPAMEGIAMVPVFRLRPSAEFLGFPESAAALARQIRLWCGDTPAPTEIQLDFNCPDNLLTDYAGFLRRLRKEIQPARISATALAGWPRVVGFRPLTEAVDWLAPMFYDLEPDDPTAAAVGKFLPMAGERALGWIGAWAGCPVPWRAGLANFERVSLFKADGTLVSHLRGWTHDELIFHPALEPLASSEGVTVYLVTAETTLAGSELASGQRLVHRQPSVAMLHKMQGAADSAGATSLIYFALPGPGIVTPYEPVELAAAPGTPPEVRVTRTSDGRLVMENFGIVGLPARPVDPEDLDQRGWQLALTAAGSGAFREGSPGGFMAIAEGSGPPELATTLSLSFSHLRAGETLTSGRILADEEPIEWRIPGTPLGGTLD